MKRIPDTPIERSHSPRSNFRLALIALLASVGFCGIFLSLGLRGIAGDGTVALCLAVSCLATALSARLFARFVR